MTRRDDEDYLDELDRQFKSNLDEITRYAELVLAKSKVPTDVVEFFDSLLQFPKGTIPKDPGYPYWLARLTRMSKTLHKRRYSDNEIANVARLIFEVIDDVSYIATEEQHVHKTRNILNLIKIIAEKNC
jgi:hypothetical protein